MNRRFSLREFALLCAPIAIVAVVALIAARRPKPVPLHLEFAVEKPTILEAFQGAKGMLVTRIAGENAAEMRMSFAEINILLRLHDAAKTRITLRQNYTQTGLRMPVNQIPATTMTFDLKTRLVACNSTPTVATPSPLIEKSWQIDRSKFAPFDFNALAREPQVRVRSMKILLVSPGWIEGETTFELLGALANAQTAVDFDLSGRVPFKGGVTGASYDTLATTPPNAANLRVVKWNLSGQTPTPPVQIGDLHGRISAGERWPLAFQVEPIDFARVKAGQQLKWTQWPAPLPK